MINRHYKQINHNQKDIGVRWVLCYGVNDKRLDLVLPKYRTVIFVHGCFWHGHKDCKNATTPKSNTDFWTAKITRNQQRDQEVWRHLEAKGWSVIIVWDCQLKKAILEETIQRVDAEIHLNGQKLQKEREARKAAHLAYRQEMKARKELEAALKAELQSESLTLSPLPSSFLLPSTKA